MPSDDWLSGEVARLTAALITIRDNYGVTFGDDVLVYGDDGDAYLSDFINEVLAK